MFNFVCNRTLHYARRCSGLENSINISISLAHKLHFLEFHQPFSSKSVKNTSKEQSITASYLINSCGFSPERALSASKYVNFTTPEKADSVLEFWKKHEFSDSQVSILIKRRPPILLSDPEKVLLPKIEFLESVGVSELDIPKMVCRSPNIMARSLKNQILPAFDFLKNLLHSNEDVIFAINRFPELLVTKLETNVAPNVEILREAGVTESGIRYSLTHIPRLLVRNPDDMKECVEKIKRIGFNPQTTMFLQGVKVMASTANSTWERKMEIYKRCGWSEEDVLAAFRGQPHCMLAAESKIIGVMDILVHKMGCRISDLVKLPVLILRSLKKIIVPRCSVYEVLLSKGLVENNLSLTRCLVFPEKKFLRRFVQCYEEEAPELLKLYQEKIELSK